MEALHSIFAGLGRVFGSLASPFYAAAHGVRSLDYRAHKRRCEWSPLTKGDPTYPGDIIRQNVDADGRKVWEVGRRKGWKPPTASV